MNSLGNIFKSRRRLVISVIILLMAVVIIMKLKSGGSNKPQYQTAQAQTGTLVMTITGSGTISSGNSVDIDTQATGVVNNVYVKDGDSVTQGEKLADITLDQASQQKQASAWASYLSAKNSLDSASTNLNTLQNTEFTANQKFINDAVARGLATDDPTYIEENAAWLAAEQSYQNQQSVIAQAQASVNSAWLNYEQISSSITAPTSGVISNLTLTPGLTITNNGGSSSSSTPSSSSSSSSQSLGTISLPQGQTQAVVDLSEVDVPNVNPGQKATLTLDAFPGETFTGHVATIDTNGSVSSGVTTYPTTIVLDTTNNKIYPNMAVSASIITKIDNNVVLVPSEAVQTVNGQSFVRELKNGQVQQVSVTTGDSNDTQTVISSGVNSGDSVIVGQTLATTGSGASSGTSPFSGTRGFGGGGVIFRGGGGRGG